MMDMAFLESIRQQRDLLSVLREHRVHYYVTASWVPLHPDARGCYNFKEPKRNQAGPASKKLHGVICSEPIATQLVNALLWGRPHEFYVYSFAVPGGAPRR